MIPTFISRNNLIEKMGADKVIIINDTQKEFIELEEIEKQSLIVEYYSKEEVLLGTKEIEKEEGIEKTIRKALFKGVEEKIINQDEQVLIYMENAVEGISNAIITVRVNRILYRMARFKVTEIADHEVIEAVIDIALEIAREGREGKKIGTIFVIGKEEDLRSYYEQLVLNPFQGYPRDLINIKNPDIKETIKEYAQLDGAFIIDIDGTIVSAGAYINAKANDIKIYSGWGTRHLAAASITRLAKCIAILVSESGGTVKVFKNGKLVLKIKP